MGLTFGKSIQESEDNVKRLLEQRKLTCQEIETLRKENQELKGILQKEITKNSKFQTITIRTSAFLILSLCLFWGTWLLWPVGKEVNMLSVQPNCSTICPSICRSIQPNCSTLGENAISNSTTNLSSALMVTPPVARPTSVSRVVTKSLPVSELSPTIVNNPGYVEEVGSEYEPWHAICDRFWVVLYYNSIHDKCFRSMFHSAAERLVRLKDEAAAAAAAADTANTDNDDLRFGQHDCTKHPSECEHKDNAYVRIYYNGHYLDYTTASCTIPGAGPVVTTETLMQWIAANVNQSCSRKHFNLLPSGRHYCIKELKKNPYSLEHEWVVYFYNASSDLHLNFTAHLISAAEKLVYTDNLYFGQRDCARHPFECEGKGRQAPFIQFYVNGFGEEYFPNHEQGRGQEGMDVAKSLGANLVPWIREVRRSNWEKRFRRGSFEM